MWKGVGALAVELQELCLVFYLFLGACLLIAFHPHSTITPGNPEKTTTQHNGCVRRFCRPAVCKHDRGANRQPV